MNFALLSSYLILKADLIVKNKESRVRKCSERLVDISELIFESLLSMFCQNIFRVLYFWHHEKSLKAPNNRNIFDAA